jgi:exoribonuclease R
MIYKIHNHKEKWIISDNQTLTETQLTLNPIEHKLFNNDTFTYDIITNNVTIIHSEIRSINYLIPGVLILQDNKTYGRHKPNGKLMYKCVPDDKHLPAFLIPYEIKHMGFSKIFNNLYVIINYSQWNNKHPQGIITQSIGEIDKLSNFYEYQVYCKKLNISIKNFNKDTTNIIKQNNIDSIINKAINTYPNIEDRTNTHEWFIFTIDPHKCSDFDDGFSIKKVTNEITQLSVYISNVSILLDILNLWESFSTRTSTIYLPDKKISMLPSILSDGLCSLQEQQTRISLVMDLFIENNTVTTIKYSNCVIKVTKNYVYEQPSLLNNSNYKQLLQCVQSLSTPHIHNVTDSHEVVSYLMILMNSNCATEMVKYNNGIFRTTTNIPTNTNIPEEFRNVVNPYGNISGKYIYGTSLRHQILDMDAYIHITSPIRRLIDLLNSIQFQRNNDIVLSDNAYVFFNKWINDLEYINTSTKCIRKLQNECALLNLYVNTPEITSNIYSGFIYDKNIKKNGSYKFTVYLQDLKLYSSVTLMYDIDLYSKHKFKLFLFNDADTLKKKIRLQIIQ